MIKVLLSIGSILIFDLFQNIECSLADTVLLIPALNEARSTFAKTLKITNMKTLAYDKNLDDKIDSIPLDDCLTIMPGSSYRYFYPSGGGKVGTEIAAAAVLEIIGTDQLTLESFKKHEQQILDNISTFSTGPTMFDLELLHPLQSNIACSNTFHCNGTVTEDLVKQLPAIAHLKGETFTSDSICLIGPQNTFLGSDFTFDNTTPDPATETTTSSANQMFNLLIIVLLFFANL